MIGWVRRNWIRIRGEQPTQNALLVYLYRVVGPRPFSGIMLEGLAGKGVESSASRSCTPA